MKERTIFKEEVWYVPRWDTLAILFRTNGEASFTYATDEIPRAFYFNLNTDWAADYKILPESQGWVYLGKL